MIRLNQGFWYDELHTLLRFVLTPWKDIVSSLPVPNNHILFTLLAKLSIRIFGIHEWSARLPSVILGGISPPVLYLFWRRRFSPFVSLAASLFLALSFWPVWFAQDARGYAGFIFFSALSNIFFLQGLERPGRGNGLLYVVFSVVSAYFYFYTGFILAAQFAYGLLWWRRSRGRDKARKYFLPLAAALIALALYAPALPQLLQYYELKGKDISAHWLNLEFLQELILLLAGTHLLAFGIGLSLVFLLGLPGLYKKWPGLVFLYLASAALLLGATRGLRIFIYARFLAFLLPFFFLGAAAGLETLAEAFSERRPRWRRQYLAAILAGLTCFFLAGSLIRYYELGKQGLKSAAQYLSRNYPAAEVVSFGMAAREYQYYDRYAKPFAGDAPLAEEDLRGRMVVAGHRGNWSAQNQALLQKLCALEKSWPSAGSEEYEVYLFRCLEPPGGHQTGK